MRNTIKKILKELYSPAGRDYKPSKYVFHKSNPFWRESIKKGGLMTSVGDCYSLHVGDDKKCKPAIFATDSSKRKDLIDTTWDDDIWKINTECANVEWFKDKHYSSGNHIVTFNDIPLECLTLVYKGTGESY